MTWHELRDEVGFPYTMEERIKDSYYYEPQGTKRRFDGIYVKARSKCNGYRSYRCCVWQGLYH